MQLWHMSTGCLKNFDCYKCTDIPLSLLLHRFVASTPRASFLEQWEQEVGELSTPKEENLLNYPASFINNDSNRLFNEDLGFKDCDQSR